MGAPFLFLGKLNKKKLLYHLVTRLLTIADLLHVVPTRLIQADRNKSATSLLIYAYEVVDNNLLRADNIRHVGTTCCESVGPNS